MLDAACHTNPQMACGGRVGRRSGHPPAGTHWKDGPCGPQCNMRNHVLNLSSRGKGPPQDPQDRPRTTPGLCLAGPLLPCMYTMYQTRHGLGTWEQPPTHKHPKPLTVDR